MNKTLKGICLATVVMGLFACTNKPQKPAQTGFLKANISQTELNNSTHYKRYHYYCNNTETGGSSYLATYFPLSKESRKKENFGFYFQLDNGKPQPFDHLENKALNARGSRFEVFYRSYYPIDGKHVELIAREHSSTYYKNLQGVRVPWLECKEG